MSVEPDGSDWDGFGVDEAERVNGEPLTAIQEVQVCHREGCDATRTRRLLFTTEYLTDEELAALREVAEYDIGEYVWDNGERVDAETIEVDSVGITGEDTVVDEPPNVCHGRPEPPSPEPHGL